MVNTKDLPWYLKLAADFLALFVPLMTAAIRDKLTAWVKKEYKEALATPNPFDDFIFLFLAQVLKLEL